MMVVLPGRNPSERTRGIVGTLHAELDEDMLSEAPALRAALRTFALALGAQLNEDGRHGKNCVVSVELRSIEFVIALGEPKLSPPP
jgi:hypothetical protein